MTSAFLGCATEDPETIQRKASALVDPPTLDAERMRQPETAMADPRAVELLRSRRQRLERLLARPETDPRDLAWAYGEWAQALHAHDQRDLARAGYLRAERLDGEDPRWPYLLGRVERSLGSFEASTAAFDRVLVLRPDDLPTRWWRAQNHRDLQDLDQARSELEALLADHPETVMVRMGLAQVDLAEGRYLDAVDHLETIRERHSDVTEVLYALVSAYRGLGDEERLAEAVARLPEEGAGRVPIPFADPWMQAVADLRRSSQHHALRGEAALRSGRLAVALREFEEALEIDPGRVDLRHDLAAVLVLAGRQAAARRHLEENLEMDPRHEPSHTLLARLFLAQGDLGKAERHLSTAVRLDPGGAAAFVFLGDLRLQQGRPAEALALYEKALTLAPHREDAHLGLVRALRALDQTSEAEARLEESLRALPGSTRLRELGQ